MKKIICLFLMFSFFVTGCYFNNAKFHELEQELTNFLNDVNESNYLTFTLSVKVDDEIAEDTIRMMADPIYIETYAEDNGKYTSVITQENDKIFEYKVRENNNVQRYFLGYIEDGPIAETQESIDIVELTSFNKNKCKIKIENNTYTITGLYKNLIDKEKIEVHTYGFEILFSEIINWLITIMIAVCTKTVIETTIYMFVFISMRETHGGYHCKSHIGCIITSTLVYLLYIFMFFYTSENFIIIISLLALVFNLIIVFMVAPVEHPNKPIRTEDLNKFRELSIKKSCLYCSIAIVLILLQYEFTIKYGYSIFIAQVTASISMLIEYCRQKIYRKEKHHGRQEKRWRTSCPRGTDRKENSREN